MQARNTRSQRFPSVENLEMWDDQEDSIELASSSLLRHSENGAVRIMMIMMRMIMIMMMMMIQVRIIFAAYNEFDQLLVPSQRPNATLRFVTLNIE